MPESANSPLYQELRALSTQAIAEEQRTITMLYRHLDELVRRTTERLESGGGTEFETGQARLEYEAMFDTDRTRLHRLRAADVGLCFGRLDLDSGETLYIGRVGIPDPADPSRALLVDWRAPRARPFYLATAVSRMGVRRRRHIRLSGRTVVRVDDELLDPAAADGTEVTGEEALLAALAGGGSGRMSSIVATIQAEQDEVIRAPDHGPLVVQGAPGTGKTVVALHRAAYLLYTRREQLARRLVLVLGPTPRFLQYIEDVLPSLGETGVALSTMGGLFPGVNAMGTDSPAAVEIKGRAVMADVVAQAVRDREVVPAEPFTVDVDGDPVTIDPQDCRAARDQARRARLPHNAARPLFLDAMFDALAAQVAGRLGADVLGGGNLLEPADVAEIRAELTEEPVLLGALDELWPDLTPERLLAELLGSADRLHTAADGYLAPAEIDALARAGADWSPADVPLLDEAAELLGHDPRAGQEQQERERRERIEYAEGALDIAYGSQSTDFDDGFEAEIISAFDIFDAEALAERHEERDDRSPVERALADRTWAFGHVIVDEAQELSEMDWRLLLRRCPTRSITVVGDVAQTSSPAGTRSWSDRLKPVLGGGWQLRHLTVNYRTPAEIMDLATAVLHHIDPTLVPPRSIRRTGIAPRLRRVTDVPAGLAGHEGGTVIGPESLLEAIRERLDGSATVLTPRQAKGLEFEHVVLAEPARIVAEHGPTDLYIALTRPTRELTVLHTAPLPECLSGLLPDSRV